MATPAEIATITMMTAGGLVRQPADTGMGRVHRPFSSPEYGGRVAGLETLYDFFINDVPDPDSAIAKDPNFDIKLRQQSDVHACMTKRELTVSSLPVRIEPSDERGIDQDLAQKIADYVDDVFKALPNRSQIYLQMEEAVLAGGKPHEWIWEKVDGYERPVRAFPLDKSQVVFDRLGNMGIRTRNNPVWGEYVSQNPNLVSEGLVKELGKHVWSFPLGKFTYHVYRAQGGAWGRPAEAGFLYWGRGEDTWLYIPVTFDQFVLRFRMKWLEKFGIPLAVLYHPDGVNAYRREIYRICDSIRGESMVLIPRPVGTGKENDKYKLTFESPPNLSYDAFQEFSERWTRPAVEKILLGGADQMQHGERGGYSADVNQYDTGPSIYFRSDAKRIDDTIDTQLIPAIVWARWPDCPRKYFPKHRLEPKEEKDQLQQLELVERASSLVPVRESDVYDRAGLEKPAEGDETVFSGQGQGGPNGTFDDWPTPMSDLLPKAKPRGAIGGGKDGGKGAVANKKPEARKE